MLSTVNDSTSDGDRLSSAGYSDGANDGDYVNDDGGADDCANDGDCAGLSSAWQCSSDAAFVCSTFLCL